MTRPSRWLAPLTLGLALGLASAPAPAQAQEPPPEGGEAPGCETARWLSPFAARRQLLRPMLS